MKIPSFFLSAMLCIGSLSAQNAAPDTSLYNPQDFYLPAFDPPAASQYRSANGNPGPLYWQNSADYLIHAALNEKDTSIYGDVTISYTNNSPDKLDYLWLQLDQNLFSPGSRGKAATSVSGYSFEGKDFANGGYHIAGATITYHGETYKMQPLVSDTRMQLRLNKPLLPGGDKISVTVNYSFSIPSYGADRMGVTYVKKGAIYQVAQWYPRMCVYDDVEGWNTLPYMGLGEFYCEYGNFDYYITAPARMIVYGSGDLQNAAEVLTSAEIKRLDLASKSDQTVTIIGADEIGQPEMRPVVKGNLTWHFMMKNTRDVAWAASEVLVWDAARVNLPSGRKAIAISAYPEESNGDTAWTRATEYLKSSIEIYSKYLFEYPWNNAVNIGGNVGGMEYPGMIFSGYQENKSLLWWLITHEIGHNWFPMIVGSNERKYMWQDEGLNTYLNDFARELFNNGEFAKDPELTGYLAFNVKVLPYRHQPMMTVPEAMNLNEYIEYYKKTSAGLQILRNLVLGKDRFDYALRKYTEAWAYKHPTPYDFFRSVNNAAGEDLNWFWKEWFFTSWTLDQAVAGLKYIADDPANGAFITIENKGKMIMPVILKIVRLNGTSETIQLPVEIWQRGGSWTIRYASAGIIEKVILDPENLLPDVDRSNNEWDYRK